MSELTVILKDDSRTYRQKFLVYVPFCVNIEDQEILRCIVEAKKNFEGEPKEITIKISLEVQ